MAATTPEGRVKAAIGKVLTRWDGHLYVEMKVPTGFGSPSLDYFGSVCVGAGAGLAFAIEAKRPRKRPTTRQEGTIERMQQGGVKVFVIDGADGCAELAGWLGRTTGVLA